MNRNCADCGGFDIEWMRKCFTHNVEYCRGCECPYCAEERFDDDDWNEGRVSEWHDHE